MTKSFRPDPNGVVSVGVADGKIAVYLDKYGAEALISAFGWDDGLSKDVEMAILTAYPEDSKQ